MTKTPTPSTGTGAALRALRLAAGLTLEQVGEVAGVSVSYLSRTENGQTSPREGWVAHVAVTIGRMIAESGEAA